MEKGFQQHVRCETAECAVGVVVVVAVAVEAAVAIGIDYPGVFEWHYQARNLLSLAGQSMWSKLLW